MSEGRKLQWLLGGCGCGLVVLIVVAVTFLWFLWPSPTTPRAPKGAADGASQKPPPARTRESILAERNREVVTVGPTVYTGTLDPGRDATVRCDPGLTLEVPAGTYTKAEPVTVKRVMVRLDAPQQIERAIAAYDVTIGKGGPLSRPIALTVTHEPVAAEEGLAAVRWDPERGVWVPLRLTRRSPTVSRVETDHLCILAVVATVAVAALGAVVANNETIQDVVTVAGRSSVGRYERHRSADRHVVVHFQKGLRPALENLFLTKDDPRRLGVNARLEAALDDGGYTDRSKSKKDRYTDGAMRDLYADVLTGMESRILSSYANFVYNPPLVVEIVVDSTFSNPKFWPGAVGLTQAYIGMSPEAVESPEELAVNLAHETFHAVQHNADLNAWVWMDHNGKWLVEATAEYAAARVAWASLDEQPFKVERVVLDGATVQSGMGDGITREFPALPLTAYKSNDATLQEHTYRGAHFLEYLFRKTTTVPDFTALFNYMTRASSLDRSEEVLERYGRNDGTPIEETWADFVAFLALDRASPAKEARKPPHPLREAQPSWTGPLDLPGAYTGTYESFTLAPTGQPAAALLKLTFECPRGGARVVVYRGTDPFDLDRTVPADRAYLTREPKVMTVPLVASERVFVVASRGDVADPQLTLRAELAALTVTATRRGGSTFRLQVETGSSGGRDQAFRWDFGDPASQAVETRTPTVEHTYRTAGEHPVRVTLLDRGQPAGEATGQVTVPSALKITIRNATTGRPLGGASVRIRYEGKTASWGTDPSGEGRVDDVPPRTVSFALEASADGYETFTKTSAIDMSQQLVVAKDVRLTPKPTVAPPPTPRPAVPPSEPAPRREPTPVATPTPKPTPEPRNADACMAKYRPRLNEVRAHNRAQDPTSNSVTTQVMGTDARCSATYNACLAAVKERGRSCAPGPDGTFTQCFIAENRGWLDCANQEVDCCEGALAAQCRVK